MNINEEMLTAFQKNFIKWHLMQEPIEGGFKTHRQQEADTFALFGLIDIVRRGFRDEPSYGYRITAIGATVLAEAGTLFGKEIRIKLNAFWYHIYDTEADDFVRDEYGKPKHFETNLSGVA